MSYDTWIGYVREALSCLDTDREVWVHLPNSGGYYEQDEFIMSVWEYVRHMYRTLKNDQKFMESVRVQQGIRNKKNGG